MALDQDVTMTERACRVEAHHVEGADPSLCYVAVYLTDERGQWLLFADYTCSAFGGQDVAGQITEDIKRVIAKILR